MTLADPLELDLYRASIQRLLSGWAQEGRPCNGSEQPLLWQELCAAGWGALGGSADDIPLLVLAMREMGASGLPVPLLGAMAAHLLLGNSSDAAGFVADVADGTARVAVALGEFDGDPAAGCVQWEDGRLTGSLSLVEDMEGATCLLVLAKDSIGLVHLPNARVAIIPTPGFAVPPMAQVMLAEAEAQCWQVSATRACHFADAARLLLVARAHGAAVRAFALACDFVGVRQQFGQPIRMFQAIRHKLADCRVRADLVEGLLDDAAAAFAHGGDTGHAVVNLVSVAAPALRRNAVEVQHVFGAVAFANEHEAAQHFTRVHADTSRLGGTRRARQVLARHLAQAPGRDAVFPIADEPENIRALRNSLRAWLAEHWGPKAQRDPARNKDADFPFIHALAEMGWLTAGWPKAHGGPGFEAFEQFVFLEEMRLGSAPMALISPSYWIVAQSIIAAGSPALQAQLLPEMAQGRISFALGYSEPQAGSDLAALATRATRDGEDFVITGQKIWTSNTEYASHIFLATRTGGDPVTDKHSGITIFVVPIDAPGVTVTRMNTLMNKTYAIMFLDEVRVPATMMVGREGDGWKVLSAALGAERIIMGGQIASLRGFFASLVIELQHDPALADDPIVWEKLAELAAELNAARALSFRSVQLVSLGRPATVEGAIAKLYGGELAERMGQTILDICGASAGLAAGAAGALLEGAASQHLRTALMLSIGGGTAEIQRNTIARNILGSAR